MTNEELVRLSLEKLGGKGNVTSATNCMTRLRIEVKDDAKIDEDAIKKIEGVLGVVHDRPGYIEIVVGPGKSRKCADICRQMGIPAADGTDTKNDWQANKAAVKAGQKQSRIKSMLKTFGDIFVPLLPGVIAAGLCSGPGHPAGPGDAQLCRELFLEHRLQPSGPHQCGFPELPDRLGRLSRC